MDVLSLTLRYILSRKIAIVSLFFIMVGVTANIVVLAVMDGFQERIKQHLRGTESDLTISWRDRAPIEHTRAVTEELKGEMASEGGPVAALSPHYFTLGILLNREKLEGFSAREQKHAVRIVGVDFQKEREVIPLDRMLTELSPEDAPYRMSDRDLADPFRERAVPGIIMGASLAKGLKLRIGDVVHLLTGDLRDLPSGKVSLEGSNLGFQLIGCFDSGRDDYDMTFVYVSRPSFEKLRYGDNPPVFADAHTIQARIVDPARVEEVRQQLLAGHPNLDVSTWEDKNLTLLAAVKSEKGIIVIIVFFIIAIAAGSILGILYMMVIEKTRDIGILRSMGLSRRKVVYVFMGCGAVLGLVGSLAGLSLGFVIVENINTIKDWLAGAPFYVEVFNPKIYRFKDIPTKLVPEWIIGTVASAFLLSVLAGVIPAVTAARLDPVRCLKDD